MRKSRCTEAQIIEMIKEQEAGMATAGIAVLGRDMVRFDARALAADTTMANRARS